MSRSRLLPLLVFAVILLLLLVLAVILRPGPTPGGDQLTLDLGGGLTMELLRIPAGTFTMGSDDGFDDERPVHEVTISRDFYIGKYEVTQEQWEAVTGTNPSGHPGSRRPVEMVSWEDAVAFTEALSRVTGHEIRLPTEAEWEYACRAGATTRYHFGDSASDLADHAWSVSNSDRTTHAVGAKLPNAWGLHDMLGNVWEWCSDRYDKGYYSRSTSTDPAGPSSGEARVLRGGGYLLRDGSVRCAARGNHPPDHRFRDLGLRVVAATP
jgi:formylglycine-generating enzyme required for sulfatase activity